MPIATVCERTSTDSGDGIREDVCVPLINSRLEELFCRIRAAGTYTAELPFLAAHTGQSPTYDFFSSELFIDLLHS